MRGSSHGPLFAHLARLLLAAHALVVEGLRVESLHIGEHLMKEAIRLMREAISHWRAPDEGGNQAGSVVTITRALEGMPIRAYRSSSEVIGGHRRSSEVIGGHRRSSSEIIGDHRRSSEVIGGHRRSSEVVGGRRRSSVAIIGTWPAKASWNSITSISLSLRPAMVST